MRERLNILLITPGLMEIPPKSWGAIEKVIWNYKIHLELLGHNVDISVPWGFGDHYDIIHSHVANQSVHDLFKANKRYIFSLHDHHVEYHGKKSNIFKINLDAMKKSIISLTHAEYLIDYFDDTDKLFYLQHGVDTNLYVDKRYIKSEHKLLCVAANGILGDPTHDRKGLRYAIESAMDLNLPITIVGPEKNKEYFDESKDLLRYDKLEIIENPSEDELIDIYNNHTIFLHPSNLEAGHPNLTLLESLSCGLPVVGTYLGNSELGGLVKCERNNEDIKSKINYVISNYDELKIKSLETAKEYDWEVVVKKLEQIYYNVVDIKENFTNARMKEKIVDIYDNTEIIHKESLEPKTKFIVDFKEGAKVTISSAVGGKNIYKIDFIDSESNDIIHTTNLVSGRWTKTNRLWYTDWIIKITDVQSGGENVIKFDLRNKDVYIKIDTTSTERLQKWVESVEKFRNKHDCIIHCMTSNNELVKDLYKDIDFVGQNFDSNRVYAKYSIGYSEDGNINPNGNTIEDNIASNVLGVTKN